MPCANPCTCAYHARKQARDAERSKNMTDERKRERADYMREYRKKKKGGKD